ncbi:hypothetical protein ALQ57_100535 [Pseudomonas amygdali pv. hibisci]|uniref:Uncharacterized protein n=1 Tax=Pseudomonas amygdali pv. hibisci TaxID=251723 RepID=A0AB34U8L0_PSEA0|nr:hypothetical protein ALO67_100519 [Pseudomonas amygdali pv. hibisci]RMN57182.1 hypothetical protein ALQ57_100535 [Pseudomonas amygdali pv. hibisci]
MSPCFQNDVLTMIQTPESATLTINLLLGKRAECLPVA